jgi:raffinose/stachyose/melibiose transport system permease protein
MGQMAVLLMFYLKGAPLSTMLFTAYISTIPSELEDAAAIDGASRWQYILHIQMPLMKIPVASMTVIALPWIWNDFLVPFIYTDTEFTTLLPMINNFIGHYSINFQVIYTAVFVTVLPLLIIYILFRRMFIQGVMAGAIKG